MIVDIPEEEEETPPVIVDIPEEEEETPPVVIEIPNEEEETPPAIIEIPNEEEETPPVVIDIPEESTSILLNKVTIYFTKGSAQLSKKAQEILDSTHSAIKKDSTIWLLLEGHTSNERGGQAQVGNDKLSKERAENAKQHLIYFGDIEDNRLRIKWYGADKPAAPNSDEETKQQNRRVVITAFRKPDF